MKTKKQKKKRNKKYIPQESRSCPCGSKQKFESCCMPYSRYGPLIKKADNRFNDIHTIIIFEINSILKNMCIRSKFLDKIYSALLDMFSFSDDALNSCKEHTYNLKKQIGCKKNSNTYQVDDFDHKFHFYIRNLYISGGVVKDALCQFSNEIGFNIMFLFGDESQKDFNKKLNKLISSFQEKENALKLKDFILIHKKGWLGSFILNRNKIEHGTFVIKPVEYLVNKNDQLLPQFPSVDTIAYNELFRNYPVNFLYFTREIIIFLLNELAYREEFMDGTHRGVIVPVKEDKMPFGDLNEDKILYKFTIMDKKTNQILTTNFSRNCPKNKNEK
ncbi:hypothetical protein ACFLY7_02600 [Patescibacteria group bacterium]